MTTILTVDDSASMRQMLAFTLRSAGYEVVEACDGLDGIEKAKANQVDAMIVDVNMPRMNGLEMISDLRKVPEYAHTPMLVLTTESGGDKKLAGRNAGATGWMVKPFVPEKLLQTLQRVIS